MILTRIFYVMKIVYLGNKNLKDDEKEIKKEPRTKRISSGSQTVIGILQSYIDFECIIATKGYIQTNK